jgi:uncharacterized protein YdhG (YjbR/CyaY superfamily)
MESSRGSFSSIDEYIATFPDDVRGKLQELRAVIRASAPEAEEKISYQMPTFALNGNLVHFAAFKRHIGFYPAPRGIQEFEKELSAYERSKGAVRFPIDQPLPLELISKIVRFRVSENLKKAETRSSQRK